MIQTLPSPSSTPSLSSPPPLPVLTVSSLSSTAMVSSPSPTSAMSTSPIPMLPILSSPPSSTVSLNSYPTNLSMIPTSTSSPSPTSNTSSTLGTSSSNTVGTNTMLSPDYSNLMTSSNGIISTAAPTAMQSYPPNQPLASNSSSSGVLISNNQPSLPTLLPIPPTINGPCGPIPSCFTSTNFSMLTLPLSPFLSVTCFRRGGADGLRTGPLFVVREFDAKVIRSSPKFQKSPTSTVTHSTVLSPSSANNSPNGSPSSITPSSQHSPSPNPLTAGSLMPTSNFSTVPLSPAKSFASNATPSAMSVLTTPNLTPPSSTSEQAFRASIRQAMLNMNLRPENATKSEIRVLKAQGILGKRAPSCSLLSASDMCKLLKAFGKHMVAEQLATAISLYLGSNQQQQQQQQQLPLPVPVTNTPQPTSLDAPIPAKVAKLHSRSRFTFNNPPKTAPSKSQNAVPANFTNSQFAMANAVPLGTTPLNLSIQQPIPAHPTMPSMGKHHFGSGISNDFDKLLDADIKRNFYDKDDENRDEPTKSKKKRRKVENGALHIGGGSANVSGLDALLVALEQSSSKPSSPLTLSRAFSTPITTSSSHHHLITATRPSPNIVPLATLTTNTSSPALNSHLLVSPTIIPLHQFSGTNSQSVTFAFPNNNNNTTPNNTNTTSSPTGSNLPPTFATPVAPIQPIPLRSRSSSPYLHARNLSSNSTLTNTTIPNQASPTSISQLSQVYPSNNTSSPFSSPTAQTRSPSVGLTGFASPMSQSTQHLPSFPMTLPSSLCAPKPLSVSRSVLTAQPSSTASSPMFSPPSSPRALQTPVMDQPPLNRSVSTDALTTQMDAIPMPSSYNTSSEDSEMTIRPPLVMS
jgi:hypothetical protein